MKQFLVILFDSCFYGSVFCLVQAGDRTEAQVKASVRYPDSTAVPTGYSDHPSASESPHEVRFDDNGVSQVFWFLE